MKMIFAALHKCAILFTNGTDTQHACARAAAWWRPLRPLPIVNGELCRRYARRSFEPFSSINREVDMLTLAELQSTLQIEYELQLEAMDEQTLRGLLADPIALNALVPAFMSFAEGRRIAEATLVQLLAREPSNAERGIPHEAAPLWAQWLKPFWMLPLFGARKGE
ncbi:hypothetical protein HDG32_005146 [Paraburkholderia sp. CI2]|uniref:hypothetical protein n=2 Tax=unclassified Paraburkholderia TaxID=2615204 RepID=UPI00161FE989|nr:hypothetical protein [Paraburkholderia sp. CI2]MBB5469005.1 hypothetical protein [Paraburkholderia sp. CI2]